MAEEEAPAAEERPQKTKEDTLRFFVVHSGATAEQSSPCTKILRQTAFRRTPRRNDLAAERFHICAVPKSAVCELRLRSNCILIIQKAVWSARTNPAVPENFLTPTGHRSGRIGGSSRVVLGHRVVLLVSELTDRGSSTVYPLSHVYGAFLC